MSSTREINVNRAGRSDDSSQDTHIRESVLAEDQNARLLPPCPSLQQALTTQVPTHLPVARRPRANNQACENCGPLNSLSRVCIAAAKYPDEATLSNYADFQTWMYTHSNKQPPIDICQSLIRLVLNRLDDFDPAVRLNVYLIITEAYQAIGQIHQALSQYEQAKNLDTSMVHSPDPIHRVRKKKMEEVGMKILFQLQFQKNLLESSNQHESDTETSNFLQSLSAGNDLAADKCRYIWRELVLLVPTNPSLAKPGAEFLLSYANTLEQHPLQYANCIYVALNLLLLHYGERIFTGGTQMDPIVALEIIAGHFEEHGQQSKQFSAIHKMAHVWGTAAVIHHLAADENRYLVCASIMRVSFEALGIHFLSSGIESLYILARKYTPRFLSMMCHDPSVKLILPDCLNYFRRLLKDSVTCIRYSSDTLDQYVTDLFNNDATDHRET